jgi:hypothetical protein
VAARGRCDVARMELARGETAFTLYRHVGLGPSSGQPHRPQGAAIDGSEEGRRGEARDAAGGGSTQSRSASSRRGWSVVWSRSMRCCREHEGTSGERRAKRAGLESGSEARGAEAGLERGAEMRGEEEGAGMRRVGGRPE